MFPAISVYRRMIIVLSCLLLVMIGSIMITNISQEIRRTKVSSEPVGKADTLGRGKLFGPSSQQGQFGPVADPINQSNRSGLPSHLLEQSEPLDARDERTIKDPNERTTILTHGNRKLNLTNIMTFWTDGPRLKVVTILVLNQDNQRVGIVTIPLGAALGYQDFRGTLGDYYYQNGRAQFQTMMEHKLESKIAHFVSIDQSAFLEFSDCLGPIKVNDQEIAFSTACEQTSQGLRTDDQEVIRAFTRKITEPRIWWKLPKLVWILTSQVDSDLSGSDMVDLYEQTKNMQVHQLIKRPVPVVIRTTLADNEKTIEQKVIEENTWCNVLAWITGGRE